MPDETDSRPHPSLELPEGTAILRNPVEEDLGDAVGFPEDSELLERHGRHFHLIEGANRSWRSLTSSSSVMASITHASNKKRPCTCFPREQVCWRRGGSDIAYSLGRLTVMGELVTSVVE
jgi:hypothetical protein